LLFPNIFVEGVDVKQIGDAIITRSVELIIFTSSIVMIAFMISGGCGGNGGGEPPVRTGFPPECNGTFVIDLSCPASSLAGSVCLPYICDVIDDSGIMPEIVDTLTIVFGSSCTDTDCFTLECLDLTGQSGVFAEEASINIESVDDMPVGPDVEGEVGFGFPKGTLFRGEDEFLLDCNSAVVP
jgi:hypothetical protein